MNASRSPKDSHWNARAKARPIERPSRRRRVVSQIAQRISAPRIPVTPDHFVAIAAPNAAPAANLHGRQTGDGTRDGGGGGGGGMPSWTATPSGVSVLASIHRRSSSRNR